MKHSQKWIEEELKKICDNHIADLLLTTGGTGFSSRDCMPEATLAVSERLVPGIPEAMRAYSMQFTKRAMLSRAAAGIRKKTLIINLPGSHWADDFPKRRSDARFFQQEPHYKHRCKQKQPARCIQHEFIEGKCSIRRSDWFRTVKKNGTHETAGKEVAYNGKAAEPVSNPFRLNRQQPAPEQNRKSPYEQAPEKEIVFHFFSEISPGKTYLPPPFTSICLTCFGTSTSSATTISFTEN